MDCVRFPPPFFLQAATGVDPAARFDSAAEYSAFGCSSRLQAQKISVAGLRTTAIDVAPSIYVSRAHMENRASVTKRYPSCYHLRSLVLLSEPEMEAAVSPPASPQNRFFIAK